MSEPKETIGVGRTIDAMSEGAARPEIAAGAEHVRSMICNRDIEVLVRESYAIAHEKGWWDRPRSASLVTLLILSEITEVLEDHRSGIPWDKEWRDEQGKPMGPPSEMADIVIRIADYCGYKKFVLDLNPRTLQPDTEKPEHEADPLYWLTRAATDICAAGNIYESEPPSAYSARMYSYAVACVFKAAEASGFDLWVAIDRKQAYNRTRPYRHGNKQA